MSNIGILGFAGVFFLLVSIAFYFVPAVAAFARNHERKVAILLLNLLLGWTFIGWLIALVWAFRD